MRYINQLFTYLLKLFTAFVVLLATYDVNQYADERCVATLLMVLQIHLSHIVDIPVVDKHKTQFMRSLYAFWVKPEL